MIPRDWSGNVTSRIAVPSGPSDSSDMAASLRRLPPTLEGCRPEDEDPRPDGARARVAASPHRRPRRHWHRDPRRGQHPPPTRTPTRPGPTPGTGCWTATGSHRRTAVPGWTPPYGATVTSPPRRTAPSSNGTCAWPSCSASPHP
jgi:hypothetical protein